RASPITHTPVSGRLHNGKSIDYACWVSRICIPKNDLVKQRLAAALRAEPLPLGARGKTEQDYRSTGRYGCPSEPKGKSGTAPRSRLDDGADSMCHKISS